MMKVFGGEKEKSGSFDLFSPTKEKNCIEEGTSEIKEPQKKTKKRIVIKSRSIKNAVPVKAILPFRPPCFFVVFLDCDDNQDIMYDGRRFEIEEEKRKWLEKEEKNNDTIIEKEKEKEVNGEKDNCVGESEKFVGTLVGAKELTSSKALKKVIHFEVEVSPSIFSGHLPGDVLGFFIFSTSLIQSYFVLFSLLFLSGIYFENNDEDVEELLERLCITHSVDRHFCLYPSSSFPSHQHSFLPPPMMSHLIFLLPHIVFLIYHLHALSVMHSKNTVISC